MHHKLVRRDTYFITHNKKCVNILEVSVRRFSVHGIFECVHKKIMRLKERGTSEGFVIYNIGELIVIVWIKSIEEKR